jgi:dihydroneopterin aldolase
MTESSIGTSETRTWDLLTVRGLTVRGHHGVFGFERRQGQDFVVDLSLSVDSRTAAVTDDLHDTVDYGRLVEDVAAVIAGDPVDLIETLAQRIADTCLSHAGVRQAEVTVHKPHAPIQVTFSDVALTINRSRSD